MPKPIAMAIYYPKRICRPVEDFSVLNVMLIVLRHEHLDSTSTVRFEPARSHQRVLL